LSDETKTPDDPSSAQRTDKKEIMGKVVSSTPTPYAEPR
jgi:hypothetical protein